MDIVPLDPGTVENKRSDHRRVIDEYDDGNNISVKKFTLRKSSFELWQWLGHHFHQNTGEQDEASQFVEWFRMLNTEGVLFVSQYVQNDVTELLVPGVTMPHQINQGDVLVFWKNQAHTFYLNAWKFQWVLPTAFDAKDLHPAKL